MENSLETKIKVPPKPINTPSVFDHFNSYLKITIPRIKVNNGVIPFNTAATELSIAVSAKAKR